MPKSAANAYYTFTLGSALFIGISTEVYFQQEMTDLNAYQTQYDWLQNVLIEANKPENRARHPWIIVYGHRPLYCTSIGECRDGMTVLYQVILVVLKYLAFIHLYKGRRRHRRQSF